MCEPYCIIHQSKRQASDLTANSLKITRLTAGVEDFFD
jgi:hypothetical protein